MARLTSAHLKLGLYLSFIVGLGLLATGCSLTSGNKNTPHVTQIRIWRINQGNDAFKDLITNFQKQNSNTQVTFTRKKADNYEIQSLSSLAARQGPDIWSLPSDWLWDHADQIFPLPDDALNDPKVKNNPTTAEAVKTLYPQGIADAITGPDGKVYGLPSSVDTLRLYYNADLFNTALEEYHKNQGSKIDNTQYAQVRQLLSKAPATWNDVLGIVQYVTKKDGNNVTRATIALGTTNNIPDASDILQLLMLQNGAKIVSLDHRNALFHIPDTASTGDKVTPGLNALDFYTSFADPTRDTYNWNPSMPPALDAFGQGKVAMVIGYESFEQQLKIKYPKTHYNTAPIPQISASPTQNPVNLIRFNTETITKVADDPTKSLAFLKQYVSSVNAAAIARDVKLFSPYLDKIKTANDPIGNQILTGQALYKKDHQAFDAAFDQMIIDVNQNGLPGDQAITVGAETINQILSGTDDQ